MKKNIITPIMVTLLSINIHAQEKPLTIDEILDLAIQNNASLKASSLKVDETDVLVGSAFNFDKTAVYYHYDQNNLAVNGLPIKVFGVSQDFKFPTVYFADKKVNKAKLNLEKTSYDINYQKLKRNILSAYYHLNYIKHKEKTYGYLDSLFRKFASAAERRFELGETNYLEQISAKSKQKQLETLHKQSLQDVIIAEEQLKKIVQVDSISILNEPLGKLELQSISVNNNIGLSYFEEHKTYYEALNQKEKQNLLPDLTVEYFQGSNSSLNQNLTGYQLGLKIPLLFSGNASKIKASKIAEDIIDTQRQDYQVKLNAEHQMLLAKLQQYEEAINYYETQGKHLSEEILKTAVSSYHEGEIDFFQYIQSIEAATDIELTYLENLNGYNQTVIALNYLIL